MQKKVLLSLLAAAPVAFTASAHENVNFDNLLQVNPTDDVWKNGGITALEFGDNQMTVKQAACTTSCDVMQVWQNKKGTELPKGLYKLNFGVLKGAVVTINGEDFTNGGEFNFDGTRFLIEIKNKVTADPYTFGQVTLNLIYDFKAQQTTLRDLFNAIWKRRGGLTLSGTRD